MLRKVVHSIFFFLLFFLYESSYAQKIMLEYMDGREIVIYTPDYKLLLLAELETGDEIPVGSIIETGRKSTCEFRLVPDGTIIKVADRTTFKIEELQGTGSQGKNQFRLMSGAVRAVTGKKPSQDEYVFLSGSSIVYPDKADFGITVKKGWEEIPFVLEGKVRYVNAQGKEIIITTDQMAGGLDENFEAQPMSIRVKRLANSLAFSSHKPQDTGSYQEETSEPTGSPTDTPVSGMTPLITESPGIAPTPEPVITSAPSPVSTHEPEEEGDETENGKEEVKEKEESGKTTASFDPTREELYPAAEYAFTAKYTGSFNFKIQEVNDEFVIISFAPPETEKKKAEEKKAEEKKTTEPPQAIDSKPESGPETAPDVQPETPPEIPAYTIFEIYDVFENRTTLSGKEVYSGFVDSLYLAKVENKVFYFAFLWEGAKKNIKPGFYLYPSGRLYSPEEDKIITIEEKEKTGDSEEGEVVVMEEELNFTGETGQKTKKEKGEKGDPLVGFNLDIGMSLTFGFFNVETGSEGLDFLANLILMLASLRTRTFVDAAIKFTGWFGIGAEVSAAIMYITVDDAGVYLLDFPLRGFIRFGSKGLYIQPYCGYYFSFMLPDGGDFQTAGYDGLDVGASVSLGGFYLEGSYVLGELTGGINYFRVGIGFVLNDILGTGK